MRKFWSILLACVVASALAFSLAGCGGDKPETDQPSTPTVSEPAPVESTEPDPPEVPEAGIGDPSSPYYGLIVEWDRSTDQWGQAWMDIDLLGQYIQDARTWYSTQPDHMTWANSNGNIAFRGGNPDTRKDPNLMLAIGSGSSNFNSDELGQVIRFTPEQSVFTVDGKEYSMAVDVYYSEKLDRVITWEEAWSSAPK
jgi:hypothetical protein